MKRRRISTSERVAIFERNSGLCHMCGLVIAAGEAWEISHDRPLALGGEDVGDNLKPAHKSCHRAHTSAEDAPRIAKAKRQHANHIGATAPTSSPLRSRGFTPAPKPPKAGVARVDKSAIPPLPRRDIFSGEPIE